MSKKPFDTVKGAVDFFKGVWPSGNGVHFHDHAGCHVAVSEDWITAASNDSPTVFVCSREQFDKENKTMSSIKKFAVDTRTLTKAQFKALKAAAKASGADVECWLWSDREEYPILVRADLDGDADMAKGHQEQYGPLVTYSQALHVLADEVAGEPVLTPKTPAQEAGFEVGDLGVVVEESMFSLGSIVKLDRDDVGMIPLWELIEGGFIDVKCSTSGGEGAHEYVYNIRKLNNVTVKP